MLFLRGRGKHTKGESTPSAAEMPNILFVLTDDQDPALDVGVTRRTRTQVSEATPEGQVYKIRSKRSPKPAHLGSTFSRTEHDGQPHDRDAVVEHAFTLNCGRQALWHAELPKDGHNIHRAGRRDGLTGPGSRPLLVLPNLIMRGRKGVFSEVR